MAGKKQPDRPGFDFERSLVEQSQTGPVVGVDEAGRGALCGPVVAGAAVFLKQKEVPGLNDSKKISPARREKLFDELVADPDIIFGVGIMDHRVIEKCNILQATILAMHEALDSLPIVPGFLLVDGLALDYKSISCKKVIKGDALCPSISAASIIAKVVRDRIMVKFDRLYPEYGLKGHKGYGTKQHLEALAAHGLSPIHRKTFEPCAQLPLF